MKRRVAWTESPVESEAVPVVPIDAPPPAQRLVYEYEVEGKRYTASNIQFRGNVQSSVMDRIESELSSRYRIGESVLVFYNPAKPEEALLEPGVPRGLLSVVIFSVILVGVGLGSILIFLISTGLFLPDPSVVAFFSLVVGLVCILLASRMLWTVIASRSWPTVEARVVRSAVTSLSDDAFGGITLMHYRPSIAYQYEISGVTYVGTQIDWGRFGTSRKRAQRRANEYPVGKLVTVYYDPSCPHRSVIEPRGWTWPFFVLVSGLGFAAGGVFLLSVMH